jgi:hypothetical protein
VVVNKQASDPQWRCFEHLSRFSGVNYTRWENRDSANNWSTKLGDFTNVTVEEMAQHVQAAAERAFLRRRSMHTPSM